MKTKNIVEAGIQFEIPISNKTNSNVKIPKRSDPVFYNKIQALNRDISIAVLNSWSSIHNRKFTNLAEPFSGSGIRALRYAIQGTGINSIYMNDIAPNSISVTRKNFDLNSKKIENLTHAYYSMDAKLFFLELRKKDIFLDYIDVDPYGSPQPFMRSALLTLQDNGIIAVTATDMPVITGLYSDKAYRRYNIPFKVRNRSYCHEIGLRMFIAYLQREGLFYKQALTPILSYYADNYVRVFLQNSKDYSMKQIIHSHGFILDCRNCSKRTVYDWEKKDKFPYNCSNCEKSVSPIGPIYLGQLHDKNLIDYMDENKLDLIHKGKIDRRSRYEKFLYLFKEDLKIDLPWFYHLGSLGKTMMLSLPSPSELVKILQNLGYEASLTHFNGQGIKTDYAIELSDGKELQIE